MRVCVSPGVLLRGHPPLLHPHYPVGHPLEVLLSASCWPDLLVASRRGYKCLLGAPPFPVQWPRCVAACCCCLRVSLLLYFYMSITMSLIKTGSEVGFNLKGLNLNVIVDIFVHTDCC